MQVREGDMLKVGDSTVTINKIKGNAVKLAVKARRSVLVRMIPGE